MPHTRLAARKGAGPALILALALLLLSACGSSSKNSTSNATASAAASSTTTPAGQGKAGPRALALRECLQRNGVKLPPGTPGAGLLGPGGKLPPGVTATQLAGALKACGLAGLAGRRLKFPALKKLSLKSPEVQAALRRFSACMREHGVTLPTPNTSGTGPVFNTATLNTRTPKFRAAATACRPVVGR
jgi:hypothetical protein